MGRVTFNMNEHIYVKLTELGEQYYVDKYNEIVVTYPITIQHYQTKKGDDGYYPFQLWDFIDTFGGLSMELCKYVDTTVLFDAHKLTPLVES